MREGLIISTVLMAVGYMGWAHAAMRDAFAQRDAALAEKADLQRRLATATKPKVACHE